MPRKRLKYVHRYLTRHGEEIYYFRRGQSGRIRLPDAYGTEEFKAAYDIAASGGKPVMPRTGVFDRRAARIESVFCNIIAGCRTRARQRDREFDLTIEWLSELARKQGYRCAVTGMALDLRAASTREARNPYAASIDRIDSNGGYTKTNVRIVALAVNIMLADWGEVVLKRVAENYIANKRERPMCQLRQARVPTLKNCP